MKLMIDYQTLLVAGYEVPCEISFDAEYEREGFSHEFGYEDMGINVSHIEIYNIDVEGSWGDFKKEILQILQEENKNPLLAEGIIDEIRYELDVNWKKYKKTVNEDLLMEKAMEATND